MKQLFDSDDDSIFLKVVPAVPPDYLMPVANKRCRAFRTPGYVRKAYG